MRENELASFSQKPRPYRHATPRQEGNQVLGDQEVQGTFGGRRRRT